MALVLAGLIAVGYTAWRHYSAGNVLSYLATFLFIEAWAIAQWGIWTEATAQRRPAGRGGWLWAGTSRALRWFIGFMFFSVAAEKFIDYTEKTFGHSAALGYFPLACCSALW